jgi:peptidoglycan-associated lipoprotein
MEYKHESSDSSSPAFSEDAWIFSGEAAWKATPRLQLTGKYAGKLLQDQDFSSYTDLMSAGFIYDLTDRWDVGGEYRILTSHDISSRLQGRSLEIGYRVMKNLWLSAGYSFDRFDADLAGDGYQGQGAYVKLRVKGDERIISGLRKAPAAGETAPQTAAAAVAEAAPAMMPPASPAPAAAEPNIPKAAPLSAATAATAAAGSVPAAAALLPDVSGADSKGPASSGAAATAASLTTSPDTVESGQPEAEEMAVFTIHFASDSSSFATGEDFATLHTAARLLRSDPTLNAAIEGHCDLRGTQSHNLKLGANRCQTVVKELEKVGVKDSQIGQTTSFGKAEPLCTDDTKKCHQMNRRSYIKIVLNPA